MSQRVLSIIAIVLLSLILRLSSILEKQTAFIKDYTLRFAPSPKVVKALSMGQEPLIADLFFTRTAIHLGENYNTPEKINLDWLYANLDIVTTLDPDFRAAYFYGGMVIPLEKEEVKRAIIFLEEGRKRSPLDWHIPFWLGCNYYYELRDYSTAAEYFAQAAKLPSSPGYLKAVEAMIYYRADQPHTALAILGALDASVEKEEEKKLIEKKITWLKKIIELEERIKRFKERFARLPSNLEEIALFGLLKEIPEDPFGRGFYLDESNGHVKSEFGFKKTPDSPEKEQKQICPRYTDNPIRK